LKLSVVIITKNEMKNIKRAIDSVKFADEIVVVDSYSDDGTPIFAESLGAVVIQNEFKGFSNMKNFAVSKATHEWVLVLDADEEIRDDLADEIKRIISKDSIYDCYGLARKSSFLGKWMNHSGWFPDYTLRLFKNGKAKFKNVRVHESLLVDGKIGYIDRKYFMNHYTYDSVKQYFEKFNSYTSLAAEDLIEKKKMAGLAQLFLNPPFSFVKQYFIKRGFLDGFHGFVLAVLSALYVFVKYLKVIFPERKG